MIISTVMTKDPVCVFDDTSVTEAKQIMNQNNFSKLPVLNHSKKLVGIITKNDIAKASPSAATSLDMYEISYLLSKLTCGKCMTKDVVTISEDTVVEEAAKIMIDTNIGCVPVVKNGINGDLRKKGKIAELALGYGGSTGALVAMGALDEGSGLTEDELFPLVKSWRNANRNILKFWWDVGDAVKHVVERGTASKQVCEKRVGRLLFTYKSGMLFITLPSGRKLSYVKPRVVTNEYGKESISYLYLICESSLSIPGPHVVAASLPV